MKSGPRIAVVVPTYRRDHLLKRWVRRLGHQTYKDWTLTVVHDGADAATRSLMETMAARDARVRYLETPERGNDFGVSPRIFGLNRVVEEGSADYVIFWDDDFYCYRNALETLSDRIREAGEPDLALAPIAHYRDIVPPPGVPIAALAHRQLDMACIVTRPSLAARFYPEVYDYLKDTRQFYCQDFELFERLRNATPPDRMAILGGPIVGIYNGMNYRERLISKLRWMKSPRAFAPSAWRR